MMVKSRLRCSIVIVSVSLLSSCSCNVGLLGYAADWRSFWMDSFQWRRAEQFTMKEVHLDGPGLLNREVSTIGTVEVVGNLGTYVVLAENHVRMLVDMSRVKSRWPARTFKVGDPMRVLGVVQSGENGHVFLSAKIVKAG